MVEERKKMELNGLSAPVLGVEEVRPAWASEWG